MSRITGIVRGQEEVELNPSLTDHTEIAKTYGVWIQGTARIIVRKGHNVKCVLAYMLQKPVTAAASDPHATAKPTSFSNCMDTIR